MLFSSIPGHNALKEKLTGAVSANHVAHAQLFSGRPGALNLPLALAMAQYLHCTNRGEDSCGQCAACSKSQKFIHPDTHFTFPYNLPGTGKDEEKTRFAIKAEWRKFLAENPIGMLSDWVSFYKGEGKYPLISRNEGREIVQKLALKPYESTSKVMIIWQPELMHHTAAHAILKILEEPPARTYFILVTNAHEKLMATILSRTQQVSIPMLTNNELDGYLSTHHDLTESRRTEIVQIAEGNLSMAISLIDRQDLHFDYFMNWMLACHGNKYNVLVNLANDFHELDKLAQQNTLTYSLSMLHETLSQYAGTPTLNQTKGEELERVNRLSKILTLEKTEKFYHHLNEASYHLERNASAKMVFLDMSLQFSKIFHH